MCRSFPAVLPLQRVYLWRRLTCVSTISPMHWQSLIYTPPRNSSAPRWTTQVSPSTFCPVWRPSWYHPLYWLFETRQRNCSRCCAICDISSRSGSSVMVVHGFGCLSIRVSANGLRLAETLTPECPKKSRRRPNAREMAREPPKPPPRARQSQKMMRQALKVRCKKSLLPV